MEERVQKIMAQAGIGSRRHNEKLIRAGRVKINGRVAKLGDKADAKRDKIELDGQPLPEPEEKYYIMLHKPRDVLSDADDLKQGRTTVLDLVDIDAHLYPVGRLDKQSMGLILLTNDGQLAHRLTHPRYGHRKVYRVKVEGHPSNEVLHQWEQGVELDDGMTAPAKVKLEKYVEGSAWLRITMREGRKRQIRRVAAQLGHPVQHLSRKQIGPLKLGSLPLGQWRHLSQGEVQALHRTAYGKDKKSSGGRSSRKGSRRRQS